VLRQCELAAANQNALFVISTNPSVCVCVCVSKFACVRVRIFICISISNSSSEEEKGSNRRCIQMFIGFVGDNENVHRVIHDLQTLLQEDNS
jgi:hypothetical protein